MSLRNHRCAPPLPYTGGVSLVDVRNDRHKKHAPWNATGPLHDSKTLKIAVYRYAATPYQASQIPADWDDMGVGAAVSMRISGFTYAGGPLAVKLCNDILSSLRKSDYVALATAVWEPDCTHGVNNEIRVSFVLNKSTTRATWIEVYNAFGIEGRFDPAPDGVIVYAGGYTWKLTFLRQLQPVSRPEWRPQNTDPVLGSDESLGMGDWKLEYVPAV